MEIIGNPLLEKFNTPFGTLPLDRIETECYEPAFNEGIKQLEEEISKITKLDKAEIEKYIYEQKNVSLDQLCQIFQVSKNTIRRDVEASLSRLKTNCIDLFFFHYPDPGHPIEDSIQEMEKLRRELAPE